MKNLKTGILLLLVMMLCTSLFTSCMRFENRKVADRVSTASEQASQTTEIAATTDKENEEGETVSTEFENEIQNPQAVVTTEDGTIIYKCPEDGIARVRPDGSEFEMIVDEELYPGDIVYHGGLIYFLGSIKAEVQVPVEQMTPNQMAHGDVIYDNIIFQIKPDGSDMTVVANGTHFCIIQNYICFGYYDKNYSGLVRMNLDNFEDVRRLPSKLCSNIFTAYGNYLVYDGTDDDEDGRTIRASVCYLDIMSGEEREIAGIDQGDDFILMQLLFVDKREEPYVYCKKTVFQGETEEEHTWFRTHFDGSSQEVVKNPGDRFAELGSGEIIPIENGAYVTIEETEIFINSSDHVTLMTADVHEVYNICVAQDDCFYYTDCDGKLHKGVYGDKTVNWSMIY